MNYSKTTDFPIADAARFFRESKNSLRFEESSPSVRKATPRTTSTRKKAEKLLSMEYL